MLFKKNHHEFVGGIDDPKDGAAVAATVFVAVLVYAVSAALCLSFLPSGLLANPPQGFLVFCGLQGLLHLRESRRGAIAL